MSDGDARTEHWTDRRRAMNVIVATVVAVLVDLAVGAWWFQGDGVVDIPPMLIKYVWGDILLVFITPGMMIAGLLLIPEILRFLRGNYAE